MYLEPISAGNVSTLGTGTTATLRKVEQEKQPIFHNL